MDISRLRSKFKGPLIGPGDSQYNNLKQEFYGGLDKNPAVIIRVANTDDIKNAILLAKQEKLELAVRSGGHSSAGYSTTEGGIVIDLRDMKQLQVDARARTLWAQPGSTAQEVAVELDRHNLVLGFGDSGSVGIGGITLGGGIGFLVRKFGLAIDNLLAAEIVTADGRILQASGDEHPDLFWALRGGGGNFGVATRFKYRLHELGECYGGLLLLPATPEVIAGFMKISSDAPDEFTAILNIMDIPGEMDFVPEEFRGTRAAMALIMYAGDAKSGEKTVASVRDLAVPLVDMLKPFRYKDIFFPEPPDYHPRVASHTMYMKYVDLNVARIILEWLNKVQAPVKAIQLRALGGAMARISESTTACAHRKSAVMANIVAFYDSEAEKTERQRWVDDFSQAINQGDNAGYVGFMGPAEKGRLTDAYPEATLRKLQQVKKKYDPDNLFRLNFNIKPAL